MNGRINSANPTLSPRRPIHTTPSKPNNYGGKTSAVNGTPNGRVGVHSFTEEQINNSITVCADGDIIDLSDEEYLSDEKFPGEQANRKIQRQRPRVLVNTRRSTPRKDIRDSAKDSSDLDDFRAYKRTYYREKLKLDPDKDSILKVVNEYVRALQWNLHYYYHGCISWGWFYPYHYAPFISDIVNFKHVDTSFEMGVPFKPYDQLLSVLPAASLSLLPKMYQSLVVSRDSPLAEYFPEEVEYDLNGKQNDWEAVVLAPFIDEGILLKATVLCNLFLTPEEQANNVHGPHLLFHNVPAKSGPRGQRGQMTVRCVEIGLDGFLLPRDKIRFGLIGDDKGALRPSENMRIYRLNQRK